MVLLWTCSNSSISFLCWGHLNCMKYFRLSVFQENEKICKTNILKHKSDHCRVVSKSDIQTAPHIELTNSTASYGCWEAEFRLIWQIILNELHIAQDIYGERLQCNVAFFCRRIAGYVISLTILGHLHLHAAIFHTCQKKSSSLMNLPFCMLFGKAK